MRTRAAGGLVALVLATSGCAWPQWGGNTEHRALAFAPVLTPATVTALVADPVADLATSAPVVSANGLGFATSDGRLLAFDLDTRGAVWSAALPAGSTAGTAPAVATTGARSTVFLTVATATDTYLLGYDVDGVRNCNPVMFTCSPVFTATLDTAPGPTTPVLVHAGKVFAHGATTLEAFDAAGVTGCATASGLATCSPVWSAPVGAATSGIGPAVTTTGIVYDPGTAGSGPVLHALAESTGAPVWSGRLAAPATASPTIAGDGSVLVPAGAQIEVFDGTGCGAATCDPVSRWQGGPGDPAGSFRATVATDGAFAVRDERERTCRGVAGGVFPVALHAERRRRGQRSGRRFDRVLPVRGPRERDDLRVGAAERGGCRPRGRDRARRLRWERARELGSRDRRLRCRARERLDRGRGRLRPGGRRAVRRPPAAGRAARGPVRRPAGPEPGVRSRDLRLHRPVRRRDELAHLHHAGGTRRDGRARRAGIHRPGREPDGDGGSRGEPGCGRRGHRRAGREHEVLGPVPPRGLPTPHGDDPPGGRSTDARLVPARGQPLALAGHRPLRDGPRPPRDPGLVQPPGRRRAERHPGRARRAGVHAERAAPGVRDRSRRRVRAVLARDRTDEPDPCRRIADRSARAPDAARRRPPAALVPAEARGRPHRARRYADARSRLDDRRLRGAGGRSPGSARLAVARATTSTRSPRRRPRSRARSTARRSTTCSTATRSTRTRPQAPCSCRPAT